MTDAEAERLDRTVAAIEKLPEHVVPKITDPDCTRCPLHEKATNVCIAGRGVVRKPTILFVGQAPGEVEDVRGSIFTGPAGELLEQAIKEFDLNPHYMTNAVKCFPGKKLSGGGDNEPTKDQIKACLPFLQQEIEALQPKVIVCLGNTALKAVAQKSGITTWSGRVVGKRGSATIFGLFHPSYILRSPGQLARFESDCKALRVLLHPEEARAHPRVYEVTPEEARAQLGMMKPPISFDFETTGVKFEGNRLRSYSFSDGERACWVNYEADPEGAGAVLKEFLQSPVPKTAHNSVFECRWSLGLFGIIPRALQYDTMLEAHLLDEEGPKALDALAARYVDAPPWDISQRMAEKGWTYETAPMEELGPYNALDSLYTARVQKAIRPKMTEGLKLCHRTVLLPLAKQCAKFQHRGLKVDMKWTSAVLARFRKEMDATKARFRALPEVKSFEAKLTTEGKKLNMNSPVQISRLFFKRMRLPVFERTASGKPSAREPALMRIPNAPAAVTEYLAWKNKQTSCNNYLIKFPKFCDKKGLIHADFNPARIVTGRIAVTDPPCTNIPDDPLVRGMLVSRWPGGKLASSDYKQLELYLVASESGDDIFLRSIREGTDAHNETAAFIWGKDFVGPSGGKPHCAECELHRAIAKRINFGIVYGVTEYKIAREFNIPVDEAAQIIKGFKRAHPKIFLWMRKQHELARKNGYVVSRFGRVRHLPGIDRMDEKHAAEALRQAGNFPIQSAGADITSTACLLLEAKLKMAKMKSMVIHHNHDALVTDIHPKELHLVPAMIVETMEKEAAAKCPWLKVPLRVDIKVTDRWGGATDPLQETK